MPHPVPTFPRLPAKTMLVATLGLLLCTVPTHLIAAPKRHPDTALWPELFAADLSDAVTRAGDWVWENGALVAKNHNTIWTTKSYANFVLDLEFKVAPESNSGVFLRSGNIKDSLAALEIQVHENADGALYGMVGAIYNAQPPARPMARPIGAWNRFTITCRDHRVALIFNGDEVFDVDLNDWKEPRKNPDGTPNKFAKALKDFSRNGPLGFQGLHGKAQSPVWYRNIRIWETP